MSSKPKPSIILIGGSFALPEFYSPITTAIASHGYEIVAPHIPSVGVATGPREGDPPTMYDGAACIAGGIEKLAAEGKDVILIGHSYGGTPISESTKGLGKMERMAQGKKGGVVRLAYMTALVPAVGRAAGAVLSDVPAENKIDMKVDEKGWLYHDPLSASAAIAFSDLPKEEGEAWVTRFPRHSATSFAGELTHAGYKDIPVSYLLCEEDICILPNIQMEGIELIERVSERKVDVTRIKTGHCPNASAPEKVIDWILDVARKVEEGYAA